MNTTRTSAVLNYCATPRTMPEIAAALDGDLSRTANAVWNLRKHGQLVNLNAGASAKVGGLFVVALESARAGRLEARAWVPRFDAAALVAAWGGAA